MFRPISIISFTEKMDLDKTKSRVIERDNYKRLDSIGRLKIDILDRLINSTIRKIESTSKWEYFNNSFIYKSNYGYDPNREDITFTINSIIRENNNYVPSNNSELELDFYNKYSKLLKRLGYLQNMKDTIYGNTNVIEFNSIHKITDTKIHSAFNNKFTLFQAKSFIDDYGYDGIKNLIRLLKDSETLNTDDLYDKIKGLYLGKDYTIDLLSWMGTYNKTGRILLDRYYDEINPKVTWEVPDIEEMKTKFLFRI